MSDASGDLGEGHRRASRKKLPLRKKWEKKSVHIHLIFLKGDDSVTFGLRDDDPVKAFFRKAFILQSLSSFGVSPKLMIGEKR